jgi:hypothetical protein
MNERGQVVRAKIVAFYIQRAFDPVLIDTLCSMSRQE